MSSRAQVGVVGASALRWEVACTRSFSSVDVSQIEKKSWCAKNKCKNDTYVYIYIYTYTYVTHKRGVAIQLIIRVLLGRILQKIE